MEKLDPKEYPTLVKYQPEMIEEAVSRLQERYLDMTRQQCLLNLEMDLEEKELLAKGK
jgi:hypothetical protein